jgi:hypothetical protein
LPALAVLQGFRPAFSASEVHMPALVVPLGLRLAFEPRCLGFRKINWELLLVRLIFIIRNNRHMPGVDIKGKKI